MPFDTSWGGLCLWRIGENCYFDADWRWRDTEVERMRGTFTLQLPEVCVIWQHPSGFFIELSSSYIMGLASRDGILCSRSRLAPCLGV